MNIKDYATLPILQGDENDYGDYDYLVESHPNDSVYWDKWKRRCDECGKYHTYNRVYTHYFYTIDGYDCMDSACCWVCELRFNFKKPFHAIRKKYRKWKKILSETIYLKKIVGSKATWRYCFEKTYKFETKFGDK